MAKIKPAPEPNQGFVRYLDQRLKKEFGDRVPPEKRPDPLETLILTVLSQHTNDRNRDRAFAELKRRFASWERVMAAPPKEIEDAIRVGGLARQKSERIKKMLEEIQRREGKLELGRLCSLAASEAREYLLSFKGVGEKTATLVMLFCCGLPAFPVDTHILRVSKRLGLIPDQTTADQAHRRLEALVPEPSYYRLHLNLIELGRHFCKARKPDCAGCCLNAKCPKAFRIKP